MSIFRSTNAPNLDFFFIHATIAWKKVLDMIETPMKASPKFCFPKYIRIDMHYAKIFIALYCMQLVLDGCSRTTNDNSASWKKKSSVISSLLWCASASDE